jgi:alanyl-tRNA synthetase
MTERLYYADSYCTRFCAHVVERLAWEGHAAVVLDRTAFYPASGGQPCDGGRLGGVAVVDVVVREEDGGIVHVLEWALGETEVAGRIDWQRRFDHMQQHTGQHILSAGFEQVLDADTVGFHVGMEVSTVDIDVAHVERAAVMAVEELANRVVWENRPVGVRLVSADELAALHLRRAPAVAGAVRIVEIADVDVNPCGGTHVAHTGEIGMIKVVRLEHRGDETRVEFVCGGRALRDYQTKNGMVNRLTGMLTVGHWELDEAVERLQAEAKQQRRDLRRVRNRLVQMEANELAEAAEGGRPSLHEPTLASAPALSGGGSVEPYRVVRRVWERREAGELRALAQALMERPGIVALLASVGERTQVCFARAEGVELDVAALVREACERLGGKGGGRPDLAQGSAPATDVERVEAVLASVLSSR